MLISIIVLAKQMGLKYVDPHQLDRLDHRDGEPLPDGYDQHTVIAQIARAVFDNFTPGFYFVIAMTGIILVLAANTAFNGFPVLGSILAQDGFLPRQLGLPRRPARLQQRHPDPGLHGDRADRAPSTPRSPS